MSFSNWHGVFIYLSSNSPNSQKGPKTAQIAAKIDCRKAIFEDTFRNTQHSKPDFLREFYDVKLVTHTGFLLCLWSEGIVYAKRCVSLTLLIFSAAYPFSLDGSAVKIVLCHAQSMNSHIAMCVNFGLQKP